MADGILVNQPTNYDEREALANLCTASLEITMPTVVDSFDNAVELAYAAYPDRIFVVDTDGVIRFKTLPGPRGFRPEEAKAALDEVLAPN